MSDDLDRQIAQEIVDEIGYEPESDIADSDSVESFFNEARASREEPAPDEPTETAAEQQWVHEPTGKVFDNELEYLKYDNGWNKNIWGNRMKEMEEQLAATRERGSGEEQQAASQKPLTMKEIKEKLFPNQPDEYRDNPVTDLVIEGIDNALGLWGAQQQQTIKGLQETVGRLESQLKESSLRSQYGVDTSVEQKLVEKHPWVKAIADPEQRMAAMKHLASQEKAPETASPKLMDRVPQRNAVDHVENSAGGPGIPDYDDSEDKFAKMSEKDQLGVLSRMIRGDGSFLGYNPND